MQGLVLLRSFSGAGSLVARGRRWRWALVRARSLPRRRSPRSGKIERRVRRHLPPRIVRRRALPALLPRRSPPSTPIAAGNGVFFRPGRVRPRSRPHRTGTTLCGWCPASPSSTASFGRPRGAAGIGWKPCSREGGTPARGPNSVGQTARRMQYASIKKNAGGTGCHGPRRSSICDRAWVLDSRGRSSGQGSEVHSLRLRLPGRGAISWPGAGGGVSFASDALDAGRDVYGRPRAALIGFGP